MDGTKTISVSKEKVDRLEHLLGEFSAQTHTVWSILVTVTGQVLIQRGFVYSFDVLAISALACGVFNSTMELASIVGEHTFHQFLQEGNKFSIYYTGISRQFLLVTLFDDRTLPGVVKVAGQEFSAQADKILRG
jgi:predicted regulator of Ras-like GTPase activity (Roadblock/LC7/MglB family)